MLVTGLYRPKRAVFSWLVLCFVLVLCCFYSKTSSSFAANQDQEGEEAVMDVCNSGSSSESRSVSVSGNPLKENSLKIRFKVGKSEDGNGRKEETSSPSSPSNHVSVPCNKLVSPGRAQKRVLVLHDSSERVVEDSNYGEKASSQLKNGEFGLNKSNKSKKEEKRIKIEVSAQADTEEKAHESYSSTYEEDEGSKKRFPLSHEVNVLQRDGKKSLLRSKIMCCLCGKNFPSMKSLFGHMRCHPDRHWRGVVPPEEKVSLVADRKLNSTHLSDSGTNAALESSSIDFGAMGEEKTCDLQIDCGGLHDPLPSWSVTARRGRGPIKNSEDRISDAAYHLLMLSSGNSTEKNKESSSSEEEEEEEERNTDLRSIEDVHGIETDSEISGLGLGKERSHDLVIGDLGSLEELRRDKDKNADSVIVENLEEKKVNYRSEERKRKRKVRALENFQALDLVDSEKYKCSTCSKSFSSHQALGGHRASHKKGKNCISMVGDIDELTVGEIEEKDGPLMEESTHIDNSPESRSDRLLEKQSMHRCQICDKVFPSGQALGGHKRCHWTGGDKPAMADAMAPTATASSVATMEIAMEDPKITRRLLDFDLNEPPVIENEDLEPAINMVDVVLASSQSLGLELQK